MSHCIEIIKNVSNCKILFPYYIDECTARKVFDSGRGRTFNLLIRSQTRYPLRHRATYDNHSLISTMYPQPKFRLEINFYSKWFVTRNKPLFEILCFGIKTDTKY